MYDIINNIYIAVPKTPTYKNELRPVLLISEEGELGVEETEGETVKG